MEKLLQHFAAFGISLSLDWQEQGIETPPTEAEIWGQLRAQYVQHLEEALADDMGDDILQSYQERIDLIDEKLKLLV
jgi:hypothetical protein